MCMFQAEIAKLTEEYTRTAGLTRVGLLEEAKLITKAAGKSQDCHSPSEWSEDLSIAVKHYDVGGPGINN
jgi:hypothetical protein